VRDCLHFEVRDSKEKAFALLRHPQRAKWHDDAGVSRSEKSPRRYNRIAAPIFSSQHEIANLSYNVVVGTPYFSSDDLVGPQARHKVVNTDERLGTTRTPTTQRGSTLMNFWQLRVHLLLGCLLVIISQSAHRRSRDEFTDVAQESFTVRMSSVRAKRKCGVSQAAQISHGLPVTWSPKVGVL
jgi:hypothetical protein